MQGFLIDLAGLVIWSSGALIFSMTARPMLRIARMSEVVR